MRGSMSLLDRLFYTTIRLDGMDSEGCPSTGTAFFFNYRKSSRDHLFLVTNRHAVKDMRSCTLRFHARKGNGPEKNGTIDIDIKDFSKLWFHHKDDLDIAVLPISRIYDLLEESGQEVFIQSISSELIPGELELYQEIQPLEDVYFIGYPNDIYDKYNYLPVARKGTAATPLSIDYENKPWFLLDGAVFPGSSGSPVMIVDQNGFIDRHDNFIPVRRVYFMGMLRSTYTYVDKRELRRKGEGSRNRSRVVYKQMMDLGVVIKSSAISNIAMRHIEDEKGRKNLRSMLNGRIRDRLGLKIGEIPVNLITAFRERNDHKGPTRMVLDDK